MIRKPSDTQSIGLHLDGLTLRLVTAEVVRNKINIKRLEAFPLIEKENGLDFAEEREKSICLELCDKHLTAASIDGKDTLIRKLRIRLLKSKDVEEAFPFEAENLIPYPPEEAIIDKIITGKDTDSTYITLLACKKAALESFLNRIHTLSIDPEVITTAPAALAAFSSEFANSQETHIVIYCGADSTLSAIVKEGKLLSSHTIPSGLNALKLAYEKDQSRDPELLPQPLNNFDFQSDDLHLAASLNQAIQKLKNDISWMLHSELKSFETSEAPLLFLGESATLKGFESLLFSDLPCKSTELKTSGGTELNQSLLKTFAVAVGSALSVLPDYPDPLNFRQKDLTYPQPWKRFKGALMLFGGSALLLSLLIFLFGEAFLGYKEDQLREDYSALLSDFKRSHQSFEAYYATKQKVGEEIPLTSLKELSKEGISSRLNLLDEELKKEPDFFPLHPNVPLVSDTLAWIASHPSIKGEEGMIRIESFNYQMVKRPEMTKKGDRYQIKVDLEITAPTPKMAREFHAALISPNNFIDPKAEVKWSANRDKYQTTFYLKDKTAYLSGVK